MHFNNKKSSTSWLSGNIATLLGMDVGDPYISLSKAKPPTTHGLLQDFETHAHVDEKTTNKKGRQTGLVDSRVGPLIILLK